MSYVYINKEKQRHKPIMKREIIEENIEKSTDLYVFY